MCALKYSCLSLYRKVW